MDHDPEVLHSTLVAVGLPSTLADMKNPTEEYMLDLITQFLTHFHIDVSTIRKPTFDQSDLALVQDSPEHISLVNISMAMASICKKIFVKDFHLLDILSPVPKRTRRNANFLANFVLYATNKRAEIEERLEVTRLKKQQLQDYRNQRMALIEAKNEQALRIAKKLQLKAQLEAEIEKLKMQKKNRKSRSDEINEKLKDVEQEKMETAQRHRNLIARAMKTRKKTEDIESKYVKSPDRHNALLREVIEQKKEYNERREVILEALKARKPAIEQFKSSLSFVRQVDATLIKVSEDYKAFAEIEKLKEQREKEKAELISLIEQESTAGTEKGNEVNIAALEAAKVQCKEHLSTFRNEHKRLLNEKKVLQKKIEESESRQQEILSKRDDIRTLIIEKEASSNKFLKECQERYDAEIKEEMEYRSNLEKMLESRSKEHKN